MGLHSFTWGCPEGPHSALCSAGECSLRCNCTVPDNSLHVPCFTIVSLCSWPMEPTQPWRTRKVRPLWILLLWALFLILPSHDLAHWRLSIDPCYFWLFTGRWCESLVDRCYACAGSISCHFQINCPDSFSYSCSGPWSFPSWVSSAPFMSLIRSGWR